MCSAIDESACRSAQMGIRMKHFKTLLWLFRTNLFISSFTFGGGYVIVPMVRKYFVRGKKAFGEEELLNMAAVAQSSPGAIAMNMSALCGYKVAGISGAAVSCLGAILPPLILLSVISHWYSAFISNQMIAAALKGMQAAVAAVIVDYIIDMVCILCKERSLVLTAMIPAVFIANYFFDVNIILLLLLCSLICMLKVLYEKKKLSGRVL